MDGLLVLCITSQINICQVEYGVLDGEPIQQHTIREIEVEKFITHRAERKYKHTLNGHMGRSSQSADTEHRTWDTWFIRISGWIGLGSSKFVSLNQKYRVCSVSWRSCLMHTR